MNRRKKCQTVLPLTFLFIYLFFFKQKHLRFRKEEITSRFSVITFQKCNRF